MVPVCSSVMLELVLAVHSYHVIAYPVLDLLRWTKSVFQYLDMGYFVELAYKMVNCTV